VDNNILLPRKQSRLAWTNNNMTHLRPARSRGEWENKTFTCN